LPKLMVGDMIVKWKSEGTTTMKPWPGRLRLMTNRDHWALKQSLVCSVGLWTVQPAPWLCVES
jgi:hypothetical protein